MNANRCLSRACGVPPINNNLAGLNGCNQPITPMTAPIVPGRIVNCDEVVQTVIEPTVTCPPTVFNHFKRVEHIVPVQKTDIHVFHNQHDYIIQEEHLIDNVVERHMGTTQTVTNVVQGPNVDLGWINTPAGANRPPINPNSVPWQPTIAGNQLSNPNALTQIGQAQMMTGSPLMNQGLLPGAFIR